MKLNLDPVPSRTSDQIASIVNSELALIDDPRIIDALKRFLVSPPRQERRSWEWSCPTMDLPTWVVAESARYEYGIVYSDNGFGPERPWGLVFSSRNDFGTDNCWYQYLVEAFLESRLIEEIDEETRSYFARIDSGMWRKREAG